MGIQPLGIVTVLLGLFMLVRGPTTAMAIFLPSTLLGAASTVLLGAGNIQPGHLLLAFLAVVIGRRRESRAVILDVVAFPRAGFWFAVLVVYAILGSYFAPRLMYGMTDVNAIGITEYGPALLLVPLGPTSGNVTQSIYTLADFACFLLVCAYASEEIHYKRLSTIVIAYCLCNLFFAFADIATYYSNTAFLLDAIRNSSYTLHIDSEFAGVKRIAGSFPEAAAFAVSAVVCFAYTASLFLDNQQPRLTLALGLVFLTLLLLSTSSTSYVSTPLLLLYLYGGSAIRLLRGHVLLPRAVFVLYAPLLLVAIVLGVVLTPPVYAVVEQFVTVLLLEKTASQSGLERAQWNLTALKNFVDTFGFGGGLGSIRASSFPIALLSNVGVFGTLLFACFAGIVLLKRHDDPDDETRAIRRAARCACVASLIAASVSGTLVDLGMPFYIFAALACGTGRRPALRGVAMAGRGVAVAPRPAIG